MPSCCPALFEKFELALPSLEELLIGALFLELEWGGVSTRFTKNRTIRLGVMGKLLTSCSGDWVMVVKFLHPVSKLLVLKVLLVHVALRAGG